MRTYIVTPNPHLLAFNAALAMMPSDKRTALGDACEVPSTKLAETLYQWWQDDRHGQRETPAEYIRLLMLVYTDAIRKKDLACHV